MRETARHMAKVMDIESYITGKSEEWETIIQSATVTYLKNTVEKLQTAQIRPPSEEHRYRSLCLVDLK